MKAMDRMYVRKVEDEHQDPLVIDLLAVVAVDYCKVLTHGGAVRLESIEEAREVVRRWMQCLADAEASRQAKLDEQLARQGEELEKGMKKALDEAEKRGKEDWEKE
jgi:hypothetical protein